MSRRDTKSIKYILNELDPAEKVEFERELNANPDLIIEVESIRRMQNKIEDLPEISPPAELSDSIIKLAAEHSAKQSKSNFRLYLSAAVLLFGLTTGSLLMDNPFSSDEAQSQASMQLNHSVIESEPEQIAPNHTAHSPWVDRNDVLRLGVLDNGLNQSRLSDMNESLNRLRPAENTFQRESVTRSLQLTGSSPRR